MRGAEQQQLQLQLPLFAELLEALAIRQDAGAVGHALLPQRDLQALREEALQVAYGAVLQRAEGPEGLAAQAAEPEELAGQDCAETGRECLGSVERGSSFFLIFDPF